MPEWFKDLMLGCESLSLNSEADRNTLWMNLESMLSGMRTRRVNDLLSDVGRNRAFELEKAYGAQRYHAFLQDQILALQEADDAGN